MSASIQTKEPAFIRVGDSALWKISLSDYLPSDGWSLAYTLINAEGKITIGSVASGDAHLIHVLPVVTADYLAGIYTWQCRVTNGTDAHTVRVGSIEVISDFSQETTLDARSFAEKTLAALEAWIERHDLAVAEYEIAGRRMKYLSPVELLKLRDQFKREVRGQSGRSGRVYLRH